MPELWQWAKPGTSVVSKEVQGKGLGLFSTSSKAVRAEQPLFILSATKCVTSEDVLDMDKRQRVKFVEDLENKCAELFPRHTSNFGPMSRLLVVLSQFYVGAIDSTASIKPFSDYALSADLKNIPIFYDQSKAPLLSKSATLGKMFAFKNTLEKINQEIIMKSFPGIDAKAFNQLFTFIRSKAVNLTPLENSSAFNPLVVCPVFDLLNHDFKPNCIIEGVFDRALDESAFVLRAIRDIQPGEELTVSYGMWGTTGLSQGRQPGTLLEIRICGRGQSIRQVHIALFV